MTNFGKNKESNISISIQINEVWQVFQETDNLKDAVLVVESILSFMQLHQTFFTIRIDAQAN